MLIGEMCLLIASVLILIGLAKGITARLYVNDYIAVVTIFIIVLLNVRGGISLSASYRLYLGGILSVLLALYCIIKRSETAGDVTRALFSAIVTAALAFMYFLQFSAEIIAAKYIVLLASVPIGVWSAISAKRTFASCLFSALVGGFLGITLYQTLIEKSGDIGGGSAFAVMWLGTLLGLIVQYLLTFLLRVTKNPRANSYFEAGEMQEKSDENKEKTTN